MVTHTCGLCSKVFKKKWNLIVHMKNIHDIGIDEKQINCSACSFETHDRRKFREHMKRRHPDKPMDRSAFEMTDSNDYKLIECKLCNRVLRYQNMKMHRARVHQIVDEPNTEYEGNMCEDPIANQQRLRRLLEDKNLGYEGGANKNSSDQQSSSDHQQTPAEPNTSQQTGAAQPTSALPTGGGVQPMETQGESTDTEEETEEPGGTAGKKTYKCSFCPNVFKQISTLKKHLHNEHSARDKQDYKKICPVCQFHPPGNTTFEMDQHFTDAHNIKVETQKLCFKSASDFFAWKLKEEAETCSKYSGRRKFSIRDNITFKCNRSGFRVSKSQGKRKCHSGFSSIKINGYCPAYIRATRNPDDTVVVLYQKTHVGHERDYKQVYLTETERITLANSLASKTPGNIVWHDVRGPVYYDDLVQPNCAAQKELKSTRNSINVCVESKTYDQPAISAWVKEKWASEEFSLLYFKEPGIPDDLSQFCIDDFVLFFMSNHQKDVFQKHGHEIICFDGTNNTNNHNIQMYTLLVSDETYTGFPCVFMFSNRNDNYVFRFFFQKIKDAVGVQTPNIFMTDFQAWYYEAWCSIMGTYPKRLLLCSWRIAENWRSSIAANIKTKEKRRQVFKTLETLMYADSKENFKSLLEDMCIKCNADPELTVFYNYFVDSYCTRLNIESWAYCYRINSDFNCHMQIDSYRHILKICRLFGWKAAMLDKTLIAILRFMGSKLTNMLVKMHQTKVLTKLHALKLHHRNCFRTDITDVSKDGNEWNVLSPDRSETFHIKKIGSCCEQCSLPCTHCKSCYHEYSCTCHDYNFRGQMCEHIHLVCRALIAEQSELEKAAAAQAEKEKESSRQIEEPHEAMDIDDDVDNIGSDSEDDPRNILEVKIQENEVQNFARALTNTPQRSLQLEFNKIVSENVKTHADILFVRKLISCIEPNLSAMRKQTVSPPMIDQRISDILKNVQPPKSASASNHHHHRSTRRARTNSDSSDDDSSSAQGSRHSSNKFASTTHFISASSAKAALQTATRGRKPVTRNAKQSVKSKAITIKFNAQIIKNTSQSSKKAAKTTKSNPPPTKPAITKTAKSSPQISSSTPTQPVRTAIILNPQKVSSSSANRVIQIQRKVQPVKILPKPDPKLLTKVELKPVIRIDPAQLAQTSTTNAVGILKISTDSAPDITQNSTTTPEVSQNSMSTPEVSQNSTDAAETSQSSSGTTEILQNSMDTAEIVPHATADIVQTPTDPADTVKNFPENLF